MVMISLVNANSSEREAVLLGEGEYGNGHLRIATIAWRIALIVSIKWFF
jgi:hypothetical protein